MHSPYKDPTSDEWREGVDLALAMLKQLEATSLNELDAQDDCREGRPQANIVSYHLDKLVLASLRTTGMDQSGVAVAFGAVLTHFVGSCLHSGVWELHRVRRAFKHRVPTELDSKRTKRFPSGENTSKAVANG